LLSSTWRPAETLLRKWLRSNKKEAFAFFSLLLAFSEEKFPAGHREEVATDFDQPLLFSFFLEREKNEN